MSKTDKQDDFLFGSDIEPFVEEQVETDNLFDNNKKEPKKEPKKKSKDKMKNIKTKVLEDPVVKISTKGTSSYKEDDIEALESVFDPIPEDPLLRNYTSDDSDRGINLDNSNIGINCEDPNIGINIYPYKSLFKSVEDSNLDKFIEYAKKIDLNKFMEYAKEINFNKYGKETDLSEFVEYAKKIDPDKYGEEIDINEYSEDIKKQDKKKWVVEKESTGHVRRDRKNLNFFPWKQKHQK